MLHHPQRTWPSVCSHAQEGHSGVMVSCGHSGRLRLTRQLQNRCRMMQATHQDSHKVSRQVWESCTTHASNLPSWSCCILLYRGGTTPSTFNGLQQTPLSTCVQMPAADRWPAGRCRVNLESKRRRVRSTWFRTGRGSMAVHRKRQVVLIAVAAAVILC